MEQKESKEAITIIKISVLKKNSKNIPLNLNYFKCFKVKLKKDYNKSKP